MRGPSIIVMMAFLNAGFLQARDDAGTNNQPGHIRNLLDAKGFTFDQKTSILPNQHTNSLRNLHFIERGPFAPLVVPVKKPGWSLWNNSSFKYVGRSTDEFSVLAPYASLALYEYDISYSLDF